MKPTNRCADTYDKCEVRKLVMVMSMELFPPVDADVPSARPIVKTPPPPSATARAAATIVQVVSALMVATFSVYVGYHVAGQYLGKEVPAIVTDQAGILEMVMTAAVAITVIGSVLLLLWNIRFHMWAVKYGKNSLPVYVIIAGAIGTALTFGMPWVPLLITGLNIQKEGSAGGSGIRKAGVFATTFGIAAVALSLADGQMPPLMGFTVVTGTLSLAAGLAAVASFAATLSGARRFMEDIRWFNRDTGTSASFDPSKITQKRPAATAADKGYLTNSTASRKSFDDPNEAMPGYPMDGFADTPTTMSMPLPYHMRHDDQPKYVSQYTFEDDTDPFATVGGKKPSSIPVPQDASHIVVHPRTPVALPETQATQPAQPPTATLPAAPTVPTTQFAAAPVVPVQPVAEVPAAPVVPVQPVAEVPAAPAAAVPSAGLPYETPTVLPNPLAQSAPVAAPRPTYVAPMMMPMPDLPQIPEQKVPTDASKGGDNSNTYVPPTLPGNTTAASTEE